MFAWRPLTFLVLLWSCPAAAWGYGYGREDDPVLKAFASAVSAVQGQDLPGARKALESVRWQVDELKQAQDLGVDLGPRAGD